MNFIRNYNSYHKNSNQKNMKKNWYLQFNLIKILINLIMKLITITKEIKQL